jgi:hypothetical protein
MENIKTYEGFWDFLKDKNPIKKPYTFKNFLYLNKELKLNVKS